MGIERSSINKCSALLFMVLCVSPFQLSLATDALLPNQTIRDGQSLISANKTFELGFFSPGTSSNRYVGIWYHNLPDQSIVWVANRDRPIMDLSGFLVINEVGDLVIFDGTGASSVVGSNSGKTSLTCVTLLDSGNLVMRELNGTGNDPVLWQSFDNPTDTLLPNMKLGLSGREKRLITSWRSSDDPGIGDFSVGVDPNGTDQFFIWQRGQVYWRSGIWNGTHFSLAPEITAYYFENFSYIPDWSGGSFSYSFRDPSIMSRAKMDPSGQIKQYTWVDGGWMVYWAQPKMFLCEVPYYCGANGICDNNTTPTCKCPFGFQPNSLMQWESGQWSGGCVRRTVVKCGTYDAFLKLQNVKLPVFFTRTGDSSIGLEECGANCTMNCSCTAYASENANGTGCLLWFQDLMGLRESTVGAQDLYVRLLASELQDLQKKRMLVIRISLAISVVVLLFGVIMCYLMWRKTKGIWETKQELLQLGIRINPTMSNRFSNPLKNGEGDKGSDCSLFSFSTISRATDSFSFSNKLGEGGFGPVYKGAFEGHMIAVKRLSRSSGQGTEEFKNEISLIANLQHTNLVRLLGYCIQKEEKILIYEYMPNKSLDYYIFDRVKGGKLDWEKRFHIIEGIAQGLLYLHKYSRLKVIHRDLKTSNILLDDEMNPKISDFGLARIFQQNENQAKTRRVAGTYGYMSPEYAMDGFFSVKSDVFSFGIIILEIVSGKKITTFELNNPTKLHGYAWELWVEGRGLELVDPSLGVVHPSDEVSKCIHVALLCVQDSAADRPTMSDVAQMLSSKTSSVPAPKQPTFSSSRSVPKGDFPSTSCGREISALNNMTLTSMEGR